jgi:hypothetical protein
MAAEPGGAPLRQELPALSRRSDLATRRRLQNAREALAGGLAGNAGRFPS